MCLCAHPFCRFLLFFIAKIRKAIGKEEGEEHIINQEEEEGEKEEEENDENDAWVNCCKLESDGNGGRRQTLSLPPSSKSANLTDTNLGLFSTRSSMLTVALPWRYKRVQDKIQQTHASVGGCAC